MDYTDTILLLQNIPGYGLVKIKEFIKNNYLFLNDEEHVRYLISTVTDKKYSTLSDNVKIIKDNCNDLGICIELCEHSGIFNKPLLLYLKGDKTLLSQKALSVIGTRKPSSHARNNARYYCKYLVLKDWITISGLAIGCDSIVHKTTVDCGGRTIGVLPMGYRPQLYQRLLEKGLIISEYPPYSKIEKYKCINRNRIISGLGKGLFVIESHKGSGSEHSIKFAYKTGVPIAYTLGFKGINEYSAHKINNTIEFDLFLQNCIN